MKKNNLLLCLLVVFAFLSCSKESDTPTVIGKWHAFSSGAKGGGNTILWEANADNSCTINDFSQFNENGSINNEGYETNPVTSLCELIDWQVRPVSWMQEGDDLFITIVDNSMAPPTTYEGKYHIISISSSEFIFQSYDDTGLALYDAYYKWIRK